jgi:putative hydrolase of the HAD superfamily
MRAIIFDVGRVLVRLDIERALQALAKDTPLTVQEIWPAIQNDPRWPDWQEGRVNPRDWHLHLCRRFGVRMSFEQFRDAWNRVIDPQPVFEESFIEKLSKKYRVALLSNIDPIHVEHIEATLSFLRFFPARIYSCRVGARKPSPLIYREALKACRTPAPQAVYVDDVPAFAEAGARLGLSALVFRSREQLLADFRSLGIDWA